MDGQITLPMKLGVEFVGTIFFLSVIVSTGNWAAIGAALALCAFLGGGISGGHFNPAVTFMFYMKDAIPATDAGLYVVAQLAGAATALFAYQNLVVKPITNSRGL
jgi:glycerol uptake facilitator-like aquaporin